MMATLRGLRIARVFAVSVCGMVLACAPAMAAKGSGKKTAAPKEPPMRVHIVRSAQEGCEPACPEWIAAQGKIDSGSPARFKKILNQLGNRKLPVLINSGGGAADEALAIGRMLRGKGLDVAVTRTVFTPCAPEAAACRKKQAKSPLRGLPDTALSICASSCAFVLAAGARRFVGASAFVGVHRLATIQTKVLRTYRMEPYRTREGSIKYRKNLLSEKVVSKKQISAPPKIYGKFEKYFVEMNISNAIMPLITATAHSSVHWLTREELRSTRIATHRMDGEQLLLGGSAPDDGWAVPAPMQGHISQDCTLRGIGCPWQFDPPTSSIDPGSSGPVAPIMTGQGLPSSAQDCTRSGLGCSWQLTPGVPADAPGVPSTPSR